MNIRICRRRFLGWLTLATAGFFIAGIVVEIIAGRRQSHGWLALFDLDKEWNFPTFYSALLLLLAAAALSCIAAECRASRSGDFRNWFALAVLFCFLGFDELFSFHNSAKHLVPLWFKHIQLFNLRWDLRWIVIAVPAAVLIGLLFVPFVLRLPRRTACGIIIAGIIYFGSAVGLEIVGGWWIGKHGKRNWTYATEAVVEETLEMVGALMFVGVLLAYIERTLGGRARLGSLQFEIEKV